MEQRTTILTLLGFFIFAGIFIWLLNTDISRTSEGADIKTSTNNGSTANVSGNDVSNNGSNKTMTTATMHTTKGDIVFELDNALAPKTVENFVTLSTTGFYSGIKIHRVEPSFVVQFGDPLSKTLPLNDPRMGSGGPGYNIPDEFHESLSNVRGTISMANAGPNTGGSQVFINLSDNTFLDFNKEPLSSKHAVFGRIVSGMGVAEKLVVGDTINSVEIK